VKIEFFLKITSQSRHTYTQHTSKGVLLFAALDDVFTDSLAQSGRKWWTILTSKATIMASVGVKGLWWTHNSTTHGSTILWLF